MRVNYGALFQEKSKDRTMDGMVNIPTDKSLWPPAWQEIYYKVYDRFESVYLPVAEPIAFGQDFFTKRKSIREFNGQPIKLKHLSNILYYSAGESKHNSPHRMQASAGARYPIELYILNFIEGELKRGVYHYNVKDHKLEYLWAIPPECDPIVYASNQWVTDATMIIVASAVVGRTVMKYGERGYRYMYLEAGAIMQNLQIHAQLNQIGSTIAGGINENKIEELLDIDGVNETVVLGIVMGTPK